MERIFEFFHSILFVFYAEPHPSGSDAMIYLTLTISAVFTFQTVYIILKKDSKIETVLVMLVPGILILTGGMMDAFVSDTIFSAPLNQSLRYMISWNTYALPLFLFVLFYFALMTVCYLLIRRKTRKRTVFIHLCGIEGVLALGLAGVLGYTVWVSRDFLLHADDFLIKLITYGLLLILYKMFIVSVALLLSLITMKIKIPKWNDEKNHKCFLLKILLLYQNSIARVCVIYCGAMIVYLLAAVIPSFYALSSPNLKEDKTVLIELSVLLLVCCIVVPAHIIWRITAPYRVLAADTENKDSIRRFLYEYTGSEAGVDGKRIALTQNYLVLNQVIMQVYKIADIKRIARKADGISISVGSKIVEVKEPDAEEIKKLRYLQQIRRVR
ncbi:MAG: hypothetical protein HFI34_04300 [Lachnospiraceae bacterium]|nr:hypothetical protein [Lachnospiraceae bacterium]